MDSRCLRLNPRQPVQPYDLQPAGLCEFRREAICRGHWLGVACAQRHAPVCYLHTYIWRPVSSAREKLTRQEPRSRPGKGLDRNFSGAGWRARRRTPGRRIAHASGRSCASPPASKTRAPPTRCDEPGAAPLAAIVSADEVIEITGSAMSALGPGCVKTRRVMIGQARPVGRRSPPHARIASINPPTPRMRITRFML